MGCREARDTTRKAIEELNQTLQKQEDAVIDAEAAFEAAERDQQKVVSANPVQIGAAIEPMEVERKSAEVPAHIMEACVQAGMCAKEELEGFKGKMEAFLAQQEKEAADKTEAQRQQAQAAEEERQRGEAAEPQRGRGREGGGSAGRDRSRSRGGHAGLFAEIAVDDAFLQETRQLAPEERQKRINERMGEEDEKRRRLEPSPLGDAGTPLLG